MGRHRRSRSLVVVLAIVMVVLLAEAGLLVAVFVSPSTSKGLEGVAASASRVWSGTEDSPGIRTRVATTLHRGYEGWIAPLWEKSAPPPGDAEFTACVDCHEDYASKRKFSSVFMDHPLHAELGVECSTCHVANAHPNPVHPLEKTCATCHDEVNEPGKCGTCHPPASLPHFYLLGAPRDRVVDCDTCHPKGAFKSTADQPLVHVGAFDGTDRSSCLSCHETSTCQKCHSEQHPSNWVSIHGPSVAYQGSSQCLACHTPTWCADRCHAVTPINPFRPRPLPSAGVSP